jgi:hypothetical protein
MGILGERRKKDYTQKKNAKEEQEGYLHINGNTD